MTAAVGEDDLFDLLGVKIPEIHGGSREVACGHKPPRPRAKRFVEWNNIATFKFTGYVAKITETTCEMCGAKTEVLEGVFSEEIKDGADGRRLTALAKGAQWPAGEEHRVEVDYRFAPFCAKCIRDLGFSRESEAPGGFELKVEG